MESEFGKGLTYCIGLFLAHTETFQALRKDKSILRSYGEVWFNAASDHLYELDTSCIADNKLRQEIEDWKDKVLTFGHSFPKPSATEKDVDWAIEKGKDLLYQIDKKLLKVDVIKAEWK